MGDGHSPGITERAKKLLVRLRQNTACLWPTSIESMTDLDMREWYADALKLLEDIENAESGGSGPEDGAVLVHVHDYPCSCGGDDRG